MGRLRVRIPIRVRVQNEPTTEQMESLSAAVARGVARAIAGGFQQARLRGLDLRPVPSAAFTVHEPSFQSQGDPTHLDEIEAAVRQGIRAGLRGESVASPDARFLLVSGPGEARAQVQIAPGQERSFWESLRRMVLQGDDQAQRLQAIEILALSIDRSEARAILRAGLESPFHRMHVRWEILDELIRNAGNQDERWSLVLHAVGTPNEQVTEFRFFNWFRQSGGRATVAFLERMLTSQDEEQRRKAALVVLFLLSLQSEERARGLEANYRRLRELAFRHHLWTSGELGASSLQQLASDQIEVLINLLLGLQITLQYGPHGDPHREEDERSIGQVIRSLSERIEQLSSLSLPELRALDARLALAIQAALRIRQHTRNMYDTVRLLRRLAGQTAPGESDEVTALFELRHRYYRAILGVLTDRDFALTLREADIAFVNFDMAVAEVKWRRVRAQFSEIQNLFNQANDIQPGAGIVQDDFFFRMREALEHAIQFHRNRLNPSPHMGGYRLSGDLQRALAGPRSLEEAIQLESLFNEMRFRTLMFLLYCVALRVHNSLAESEVGSESFREEQGRILRALRQEIEGYYRSDQFEQFAGRYEAINQRIEEVVDAIRSRARRDLLIQLGITAIAALLTAGLGLAARLATIRYVYSGVMAARTATTITLLVEATTFTAIQLSGESLALGRRVTAGEAARAFFQNVIFFGAFRFLGRYTSRLGRGDTLLRFIGPHAINLGAMTGVSALVQRVETGEWPQNWAEFFLYNLANYIIIAGANAAVMTIGRPALQARINEGVETIQAENTRLLRWMEVRIRSGRLTEVEFEAFRRARSELNRRGREFYRFLYNEGLVGREEFEAVEEHLNFTDRALQSMQYTPLPQLPGGSGGAQPIRSVPSLAGRAGLSRLGESIVYRFDPSRPPEGLQTILSEFEARGFNVSRSPSGLIQILNPAGEPYAILEPGPLVEALPALPLPRPPTILEQAAGQPLTGEAEITRQLTRINPRLISTLEAYTPQAVGLRALGIFFQFRHELNTRWSLDAVRGVANMLREERGITRHQVARLFRAGLPSDHLEALFLRYQRIADLPGANLLVGEHFTPQETAQLVRAYDQIRIARLRLPDGMTRDALRGLLFWSRQGEEALLEQLRNIPLADRLARLEAVAAQAASGMAVAQDAQARLRARVAGDAQAIAGLDRLAREGRSALIEDLDLFNAVHARRRLGVIASLSDKEMRGLAEIQRLEQAENPIYWEDFVDLPDAGLRLVLDVVADIAPRAASGLDRVLYEFMEKGDAPAGRFVNEIQGSLGQLLAARTDIRRFPGYQLTFEIQQVGRVIDIRLVGGGPDIDIEVKTNLARPGRRAQPSIIENEIIYDIIQYAPGGYRNLVYMYHPDVGQAGLDSVRRAFIRLFAHADVLAGLHARGVDPTAARADFNQQAANIFTFYELQ